MDPFLPSDFSPAGLLFLNPELQAYSNVITVDDAYVRYSAEFAHLAYKLPAMPPPANVSTDGSVAPPYIDPELFIARHRAHLDISGLARVINDAQIATNGTFSYHDDLYFAANIYRTVRVSAPGVLMLMTPDPMLGSNVSVITRFTSNVVRPGDRLKLSMNNGRLVLNVDVFTVLSDTELALDIDSVTATDGGLSATFLRQLLSDPSDAPIILHGIRIPDVERIAHINYTRIVTSSNAHLLDMSPLPSNYNPQLVKLLYPDMRYLSDTDAYVTYANRWGVNDYRIAAATDLYNNEAPVINGLHVKGTFVWDNILLTSVSIDDASVSCNVETTTLITERAIKRYIERKFQEPATFVDMEVTGTAVLRGNNTTVSSCNIVIGTQCNPDAHVSVLSTVELTRPLRCTDGLVVASSVENADGHWKVTCRDSNPVALVASYVDSGGGTTPSPIITDILRLDYDAGLCNARMSFTGDVVATGQLLALCDRSVKSDLRLIDSPLEKLKALDAYTYIPANSSRRAAGLVAQDVLAVLPEATRPIDTNDGDAASPQPLLAVSYPGITALLVGAVNELANKVRLLMMQGDIISAC